MSDHKNLKLIKYDMLVYPLYEVHCTLQIYVLNSIILTNKEIKLKYDDDERVALQCGRTMNIF